MEQLFLMPGEERCERFKDGNGVPKVHYSYCSMRGAYFDCESRKPEPSLPLSAGRRKQGRRLFFRLYQVQSCAQTSSSTLPAMQRALSEIKKQLESSSLRGSTSATLKPGTTGYPLRSRPRRMPVI